MTERVMATDGFWVGPDTAPDTFGLVSMLGGGGEGEVWKALLPLSADGRRTVAVKIMRATGDAEEAERWEQTGRLLRALSHPGLVRVTDVFPGPGMHRTGEPGVGRYVYVVMDYVGGTSLTEWTAENPDMTASQRLGMLRMVAAALDSMHEGARTEVSATHGDVKPANIVVGRGQGAVLVDLGLTQLADGASVAGRSAPYAAPELRVSGTPPTPATDRFAFAVTVAQALTGAPPPVGTDGWLDPAALETQLRQCPLSARRHALIQQIMSVIAAPPEARPSGLRLWLDSTVDSLSQVTGPAHGQPSVPAASMAAAPQPDIGETPSDVDDRSELGSTSSSQYWRRPRPALLVLVLLILVSSAAVAAVWPQFIGATTTKNGVTTTKNGVTTTKNTADGITGAPTPGALPSSLPITIGGPPAALSTQQIAAHHSGPIVDGAPGGLPGTTSVVSVPSLPPSTPPPPPPSPALQLATKSLPPLTVGTAWSATFTGTGGTTPYRWAISGGALPQGFVLQTSSGQLNGTARTPTVSTFTVEVTDAAGTAASRQFTLSPTPIIGDLDRDGQVDCTDKNILMSQWQQTGPGHSADLNHDDTVNITDLSIMLSHWTGGSTSC